MGLVLELYDGQTPLDEEEKEGLLIPTIATRAELDEFEQKNIEEAVQWSIARRLSRQDILTEAFVKLLHKRMYGVVWSWAGEFRKTNKNLGVDKWMIGMELKTLLDDVQFWMVNKVYVADEIAIRTKHRIVSIHCFPNGNGRHSRLLADIIINRMFGMKVFSWGLADLTRAGDVRKEYLHAIKAADKGDYTLLLAFARS
jgi:Fic-DOC domain mobile mystery protein B